MSPDEIKALTSLLALFQEFASKGAIWGFVALLIGPYVLQVVYAWHNERQRKLTEANAERRFAAVERMYENNAELVRNYGKLADSLKDVVVTNTAAMTTVCDAIDRMERMHK